VVSGATTQNEKIAALEQNLKALGDKGAAVARQLIALANAAL
jgi:hypothetical protein